MGQQASLSVPFLKNINPINFKPQLHEFQSQYVQRIKQTPFVGSTLYNSLPSIYLEPIQITMQTLIMSRMNTNRLFPKEQILKIIDNVLSGLNQLKMKSFQGYGNLALNSIFYHKQTKNFKIINPAYFNSTNYVMVRSRTKFCLLSPEQLLDLVQQSEEVNKNFKSDIFVLAICILQICTLSDSRQIYCSETYNIIDLQIRERLKKVEEYYSCSELVGLMEKCLQYEIEKRIDLEAASKQVKLLIEKEKRNVSKQNTQVSPAKPGLDPQNSPKKGSLPFGPEHLPRRLPQPNN